MKVDEILTEIPDSVYAYIRESSLSVTVVNLVKGTSESSESADGNN